MAKARSTTTGASVRARAAAKPRSARATARPVSKSAVKPHKRHRLLGFLATMFALLALAGAAARALPADLQELPFAPIVVSATPWFTVLGLIALLLAIVSRRILAALIAIAAIACNGYWQYPFFYSTDPLPQAAQNAVAAASPNTSDAYARVMTFNVYKGQADPQAIVELVRDQRVEVLALQETTEDFVKKLNEAGIEHYPPLADPTDDDVNSSASFMPGGTVDMGGQQIRFVSVHTTAPVPGYWRQWKRSLDELGLMREHTDTRYIFMGDFNATYDHTPFRDFLGDRFVDAARESGHGFTFSWPTNRAAVPMFAGIDHVVLDQGMKAGQCKVVKVEGSDHAALLATVAVG